MAAYVRIRNEDGVLVAKTTIEWFDTILRLNGSDVKKDGEYYTWLVDAVVTFDGFSFYLWKGYKAKVVFEKY